MLTAVPGEVHRNGRKRKTPDTGEVVAAVAKTARVRGQRCTFELPSEGGVKCGARAFFARPGEGEERTRCKEHREKDMVNPFRQRCLFEGCHRNPFFGYPGTEKKLRCARHKDAGMVDIKSKRCMHERCMKFACWGFKGAQRGGAAWCSAHMQPGMFNFRAPHKSGMDPVDIRTRNSNNNKMCAYPGCSGRARFGLPGDLPRNRRCKIHRTLGMINCRVSTCACSVDGCDRKAVCGPRGEKLSEKKCEIHRVAAPPESTNRILCYIVGCDNAASWGWDDGERMRCKNHKEHGMLNLNRVKDHCKVPGCRSVPSFGFLGERPLRTRCRAHAEEGMADVKHVGHAPHSAPAPPIPEMYGDPAFDPHPLKHPRPDCSPHLMPPPQNHRSLFSHDLLPEVPSAFDNTHRGGYLGGGAEVVGGGVYHSGCDPCFGGHMPMSCGIEMCDPIGVGEFGGRFSHPLLASEVGWYGTPYGSDSLPVQVLPEDAVRGGGQGVSWLGLQHPMLQEAVLNELTVQGMGLLPPRMQSHPAHGRDEAMDADPMVGILRPIPRGGRPTTHPTMHHPGPPIVDHQSQFLVREHSAADMQYPHFCMVPVPLNFAEQPSPRHHPHDQLEVLEAPDDDEVIGIVHSPLPFSTDTNMGRCHPSPPPPALNHDVPPATPTATRATKSGWHCLHPDCHRRASYGFPPPVTGATAKALRCAQHTEPGMVNVVGRRCSEESCNRLCVFGFPGMWPPVRCARHKLQGMEDVKNRRCAAEGCQVRAEWGLRQEGGARWCRQHKQPGMHYIGATLCDIPGCEHKPSFGLPHWDKGTRCARHKAEGMVNVTAKKCSHPDCKKPPIYALPGNHPTTCAGHKQPATATQAHLCKQLACCQVATHGRPGEGHPLWCQQHSSHDMWPLPTLPEARRRTPADASRTPSAPTGPEETARDPTLECEGGRVQRSPTLECEGAKVERRPRAARKRAKCTSTGCTYPAFYGMPDHPKPTQCYVHKTKGMVGWCQKNPPLCEKHATFGYTTIGLATRCQHHAMEGMVSLAQ